MIRTTEQNQLFEKKKQTTTRHTPYWRGVRGAGLPDVGEQPLELRNGTTTTRKPLQPLELRSAPIPTTQQRVQPATSLNNSDKSNGPRGLNNETLTLLKLAPTYCIQM